MNNNLPIEQKRIKKPFFKKVINFVKNIFKKDKTKAERKMRDRIETNAARLREAYKKNEPAFNTTHDIDKKRKISEIIKLVEKDPEALKNLDIDKLKIIDKYYKEEIAEYKKKISNAS